MTDFREGEKAAATAEKDYRISGREAGSWNGVDFTGVVGGNPAPLRLKSATYNCKMPVPHDICIRGAGVVGQTLALLLARDRLRVALVRDAAGLVASDAASAPIQPPEPAPADIRAYALNAASRHMLESLRGWPGGDASTAVVGMQVLADRGAAVAFQPTANDASALAWIVDVAALESSLAEAVRYQPLIENVTAPVNAPLTVVCEGRHSATRAEFGAHFDVTPYPQRAIAARLRTSTPHAGIARQWFLADGGILALLPMGADDGHGLALVWSVDALKAPALLALNDEEFARRLETATGLVDQSLTVCAATRADWSLQLSRVDHWCGSIVSSSNQPQRSWALAGDAAHTIHPLAGQGLNLGLGDAAELAKVLREREYWRTPGDLRLLRRYERARKAAVWPMTLATDGLQQLFGRQGEQWEQLRAWGMRGFDASGPLKNWVVKQASGASV